MMISLISFVIFLLQKIMGIFPLFLSTRPFKLLAGILQSNPPASHTKTKMETSLCRTDKIRDHLSRQAAEAGCCCGCWECMEPGARTHQPFFGLGGVQRNVGVPSSSVSKENSSLCSPGPATPTYPSNLHFPSFPFLS